MVWVKQQLMLAVDLSCKTLAYNIWGPRIDACTTNQKEKSRVVSTARWKLLSFGEIRWITIVKDASISSFAVFNFCWSINQYVRSTFPLFGSLRLDECREFKHGKSYVVSSRTACGIVKVRSCLRKQNWERERRERRWEERERIEDVGNEK